MPMHLRFASSCVAVLSALACTEEASEWSAPEMALVEELRLDPHAEDFSDTGPLYVGPGGEIVVPQYQDWHLVLFDSAGRRIATVGRRGAGPGEFEFVGRSGWIADTLWVYDGPQDRITFISRDGSVLRTSAMPDPISRAAHFGPPGSMMFFTPLAVRPDGRIFGRAQVRPPPGDFERPDVLVEAALGDSARIVVTIPPGDEDRWYMSVEQFRRQVPFAARPIIGTSPDGSRFAWLVTDVQAEHGGIFTLTMLDADADTLFVRSYPYRGVPVPAHARDSVLDAMIPAPDRRPREGPANLPERFQELARERMPPVYPPVTAMVLGMDGTTWLTVPETPHSSRALVLNARGDPIATAALPPNTTIRQATETHAWATERDEVGLVSVVRYRLRPPS